MLCRQGTPQPPGSPLLPSSGAVLRMLSGSSSFRPGFSGSCSLWGAPGSSWGERETGGWLWWWFPSCEHRTGQRDLLSPSRHGHIYTNPTQSQPTATQSQPNTTQSPTQSKAQPNPKPIHLSPNPNPTQCKGQPNPKPTQPKVQPDLKHQQGWDTASLSPLGKVPSPHLSLPSCSSQPYHWSTPSPSLFRVLRMHPTSHPTPQPHTSYRGNTSPSAWMAVGSPQSAHDTGSGQAMESTAFPWCPHSVSTVSPWCPRGDSTPGPANHVPPPP